MDPQQLQPQMQIVAPLQSTGNGLVTHDVAQQITSNQSKLLAGVVTVLIAAATAWLSSAGTTREAAFKDALNAAVKEIVAQQQKPVSPVVVQPVAPVQPAPAPVSPAPVPIQPAATDVALQKILDRMDAIEKRLPPPPKAPEPKIGPSVSGP